MQVATLNINYLYFGLQYISNPHCLHCRILSILRTAVHLEEVVGGSGTQPADDWWSRDYSKQGHGLFIAPRIKGTLYVILSEPLFIELLGRFITLEIEGHSGVYILSINHLPHFEEKNFPSSSVCFKGFIRWIGEN